MKSFHSNPEVSKGAEEDGAGCGDCRDFNDAPDSPRSTEGPRVDGSLPVPPVLTHFSVVRHETLVYEEYHVCPLEIIIQHYFV